MTFDPSALHALEPDFWRAPSAHNTQPWALTYHDTHAEIGWDPARALPVSDPTERDLLLSMGAFVECCLIVSADAGLAVDFEPDLGSGGRGAGLADRVVGRLVAGRQPYRTAFTTRDVRRRATNRGAYLPGGVGTDLLDELGAIAAEHGGEVRRIPRRRLSPLLRAADLHMFGTPPVTRELSAWLRLTPRDPRYRLDGLTDRALALGRPEALGLRAALALYPMLHRIGLPRILAAGSRGLLDDDGDALVLVGPPRADRAAQVSMGRVLLRMWLTLGSHGHATHPLSQIIDCDRTAADLARLLDVDDPARLINVARAGQPAAPAARSARLRSGPHV